MRKEAYQLMVFYDKKKLEKKKKKERKLYLCAKDLRIWNHN